MTEPPIIPKIDRLVRLPFGLFLREFLGLKADNILVAYDTAKLVEIIDPEEEYIHIEWPNELNCYTSPAIWRKAAWMDYYIRYERLREHCNLENRVRDAELDTIRRLTRQLNHYRKPLGDKKVEKDNNERSAELVKRRDLSTIKFLSVNVDCLLAADKNLTDYRQKLKAQKEGKKI
jgi:ribonuclease BN (tRNA processing enzyme)